MRSTTVTFQGIKARATYQCECGTCGKKLTRTAIAEHTVNPFNKNDSGVPKTEREVYYAAKAEAEREAAEKQGSKVTCIDCEDEPNRALLLEMAAEPQRVFPEPERYFNSPMHVLADRHHVDRVYEKCECGSACCSGWKNKAGFRVTPKGLKRATALKAKAADA